MESSQRTNTILRTLVWLVTFVAWAYLRKPSGSGLLDIQSGPLGFLGLTLIGLGLALHLWSILTLAQGIGASFSAPITLLMHGPYRYVRNPLYLGAASVFAGIYLLYPPWDPKDLAVVVVLATIAHLTVVRLEEPATRARLGEPYDEYRRQVPRWIPRVTRTFALVAIIVGAAVSVVLVLRAGQRAPVVLIVLFAGWVLSPFLALGLAEVKGKGLSVVVRETLYAVMLIITLGSLSVYAYFVLRPLKSQPASVFLLVPLGAWALIAIAIPVAALREKKTKKPSTLPSGAGGAHGT